MTLFIKNMVCNRCILVVRQIFDKLEIPVSSVSLGEVIVPYDLIDSEVGKIQEALHQVGFELLDDRKHKLIEKAKMLLIEQIHHVEAADRKVNFSTLLQEELRIDYNYLSSLFSQTESLTIEQFVILQRVERAKELLVYNELTLSEIAYKLGYSSVQHLSTQFKKVTGLTPSHFKTIKAQRRKPLDQL